MQSVLAIDVAKGKSMVTLINSCGEVLIEPYEISHSIKDFSNLLNRIKQLKLDNISVIMESTGIYHRPVERFFLENNFKQYIRPDNIYLNMNALARQYFALDQLCTNLKIDIKIWFIFVFQSMNYYLKKKLSIVILLYLLSQIIHTLKSSPTLELIIYNITLKIIIISVGNRN